MLLQSKIALVTGAGRGIGAAVARRLAAEGAHVIVHYHTSRKSAEALAEEIGGLALGCDLTDPSARRGNGRRCAFPLRAHRHF